MSSRRKCRAAGQFTIAVGQRVVVAVPVTALSPPGGATATTRRAEALMTGVSPTSEKGKATEFRDSVS